MTSSTKSEIPSAGSFSDAGNALCSLDFSWFVLKTRSNAEFKVYSRLIKCDVVCYFPTHSSVRQWSDRKKKVQIPLISSVIFVFCTKKQLYSLTRLEGVTGILYFLGAPAKVRMSEIEMLKCIEREWNGKAIEHVGETIVKGDIVRVSRGPFKGLQGISVDSDGKHRLLISIESLGAVFTVSIPRSFVKKLTMNQAA